MMDRNLTSACKAFSYGKRPAIETLGYQMSLAGARDYTITIEVPNE